jgi:peptide/nickel transport system substrate-binding protein
LATSWNQLDETTWEIKIREGVLFQNGEPLNAQAVANSLNYLLNVDTPVDGFDSENIESIEATDEYTVVVKTVEFDLLFASRLILPTTGILAPSAYKGDGTVDPYGTGTGPFILVDEVPEQSLTLVKNDNYWGGDVKVDNLTIRYIPDGDVRATMLQTGELDIAVNLPFSQVPLLESDSNVQLAPHPEPRTVTVYMNNEQGPLADVLIRKAVTHAVDKAAISEAVLEGFGIPAAGPFRDDETWFNTDLTAETFDPDLAKELLAEAGYEEGELTLRLWTYAMRADLPPIAIAIQGMLSDVGIEAEIRLANYYTLKNEVLGGDFDMFIVSRGYMIDVNDPRGFLLSDYACGGSFNLGRYCSEEVDAMIAKAGEILDTQERNEIYRQIQEIVVTDDAASLWVDHPIIIEGHRSNVMNYTPNAFDDHYLVSAGLDISQ